MEPSSSQLFYSKDGSLSLQSSGCCKGTNVSAQFYHTLSPHSYHHTHYSSSMANYFNSYFPSQMSTNYNSQESMTPQHQQRQEQYYYQNDLKLDSSMLFNNSSLYGSSSSSSYSPLSSTSTSMSSTFSPSNYYLNSKNTNENNKYQILVSPITDRIQQHHGLENGLETSSVVSFNKSPSSYSSNMMHRVNSNSINLSIKNNSNDSSKIVPNSSFITPELLSIEGN